MDLRPKQMTWSHLKARDLNLEAKTITNLTKQKQNS